MTTRIKYQNEIHGMSIGFRKMARTACFDCLNGSDHLISNGNPCPSVYGITCTTTQESMP